MKKRIWAAVLCLCMVFTLLPETARAATSGTCGANVTWELNDGTLTISGTGPMASYSNSSGQPWYSYRSSIQNIIIGDGVTSIGSFAFSGAQNLTKITVGDNVSSIGKGAFGNCSNLRGITLPESITSIGEIAFVFSGLRSITIPDSVVNIDVAAFQGCSDLVAVKLPKELKYMGNSAFIFCSSLKDVNIPDGLTTIEYDTFSGCTSLSAITIPNGVMTIDTGAFASTSLTHVTIPASVTTIGGSYDSGSFDLTGSVFRDCSQLTEILIDAANPNYASQDGVIFSKNMNRLLCCPPGKGGSYAIPNGVSTIGDTAFSTSTNLSNIIIPGSLGDWNRSGFSGCTGLISVTISEGVSSIPVHAFGGCTSLTEINMPTSLTSIGNLAFVGCTSLSDVVLPSGVVNIGDSAFEDCTNLSNVVLQEGVAYIGEDAFRDCKNLTRLVLPDSLTSIGNQALFHCTGLTSAGPVGGDYSIQMGWKTAIPNYAFNRAMGGEGYDPNQMNMTSVTIPDGVTTIGRDAFYICSPITSVTIPRSVTTIDGTPFPSSSVKDVYYAGSKEDWENISISTLQYVGEPHWLDSATIHYGEESNPNLATIQSLTLTKNGTTFDLLTQTAEFEENATDTADVSVTVNWGDEETGRTFLIQDKDTYVELPATFAPGKIFAPDAPIYVIATNADADTLLDWKELKLEITAPEEPSHSLTLWTDANCTTPITAMTSTYGSFSWEQTGGNYDTVYLKAEWVGVENDGVVLTAPEGFSFAPYEMVTTRNLSVPAGGTGVEVVPVYPIYAESPGTELTFAVEGTDTKLTIPVTENSEAGNVYYRDSFTEQPTGSLHMSDFSLSGFNTSSRAYNQSTALFSASLSAAAYNERGIEQTLANFGFTQIVPCNYNFGNDQISVNQNQVACSFATKKYIVNGEVYTIVAVPIRGTVEREWYSNFEIGSDEIHRGFTNGKNYVLSQLKGYMDTLQDKGLIADRTKILITGHSRAAAVADLLALDLNTMYYDWYASRDNMYVYTFATPNSVSDSVTYSQDVQYNIFNIQNYQDVVAHVPGTFYSPGVNLYMNYPGDANYSKHCAAFLNEFNRVVKSQSPAHPDYYGWDNYTEIVIAGVDNWFATAAADTFGDAIASAMLSKKDPTLWAPILRGSLPAAIYDIYKTPERVCEYFTDRLWRNHAMETYICWLNTITDGFKFSEISNGAWVKVMCPVDVMVYDENHQIVSRIENNEVVQCDGPYCGVSGNEKVFYLANSSYTFEITGYDSGSMDIEITEYDEDNQQSKFVSYLDIPVETGETVTLDAENCGLANSRYSLVMDGEQRDADYTATGSELNKFTVTAGAEGSGYALGSGSYSEGQRVTLYALTDNGLFSGWYADGTLVSGDSTYSFTAMEDVFITAKFTSTTPIPPTPGHIHSWSAAWSRDESHHWHECLAGGCTVTSNGKKAGYGAHVYDDDTDTTCNTCGYIRTVTPPAPEHIHNWSAVWSHDKNCHWCECLVNGCTVTANSEKAGYGAHSYDDDADTTCNTCGYVREITPPAPEHTHDWSAAWSGDENHHWHNCTAVDCPITTDSQKDGYAAHTSDGGKVTTPATPYQNGVRTYSCTVCGYVIRTESIPATGGGSSSGGGSGGGTSNGYTVSVPSHVTGGTVRVSPNRAGKGATVVITTTPNSGYELDRLTVTDANGNELELKDIGNGRFTFTMPSSRVTADAAFTAVTNPPAEPENPETPVRVSFTDVPSGAYYYDAVTWAVEQGITSGISATTFSPNASCTRAQMVTFLWRAAGSPAPRGGVNPFADVQSGSYCYDAVLWAVEQGITSGTSATTFSPDAAVTRGQTVTFLYRAAGSPAAGGSNSFGDVASNAYYAGAVQWAAGKGVTSGTSATTFSPNDDCTRAQIMTFLYRDRANYSNLQKSQQPRRARRPRRAA